MTTPNSAAFAEAFRIALRRAVTSDASSITWNMTHVLPSEAYLDFAAHCARKLADVPFSAAALRRAALSWDANAGGPLFGHQRQAFATSMKLQPIVDWAELASSLRQQGLFSSGTFRDDERSLVADTEGMNVRVVVSSAADVELVTLTSRGVGWSITGIGADRGYAEGTLADVPNLIEHVNESVKTIRRAAEEDLVADHLAAELVGVDLEYVLDPSDACDARLLDVLDGDVETLLRWETTEDGVEAIVYVVSEENDDAPEGRTFRIASVAPDRLDEQPSFDREDLLEGGKLTLDDEGRGRFRSSLVTTDRGIGAMLDFRVQDGGLDVRIDVYKTGLRGRVLASRTVSYDLPTPRADLSPSV